MQYCRRNRIWHKESEQFFWSYGTFLDVFGKLFLFNKLKRFEKNQPRKHVKAIKQVKVPQRKENLLQFSKNLQELKKIFLKTLFTAKFNIARRLLSLQTEPEFIQEITFLLQKSPLDVPGVNMKNFFDQSKATKLPAGEALIFLAWIKIAEKEYWFTPCR